jgi:hypothetical protein
MSPQPVMSRFLQWPVHLRDRLGFYIPRLEPATVSLILAQGSLSPTILWHYSPGGIVKVSTPAQAS